MEGQIDSAHSSSLQRVDTADAHDTHWTRPSTNINPRIQVQATKLRRALRGNSTPIQERANPGLRPNHDIRCPFHRADSPNSSYNVASVIVREDDTHSHFHFIACGDPKTCIEQEGKRASNKKHGASSAQLPSRQTWTNISILSRRASNNCQQDRQAMREGNFTGIGNRWDRFQIAHPSDWARAIWPLFSSAASCWPPSIVLRRIKV
jgi:phthalate 4,5-dioxygenase